MKAAIGLLCTFATVFAQPPNLPSHNQSSHNQYGAVTLASLDATGLIKLNGTSITGPLHLTGSLIAKNGELGSLEILGEANLTDSLVKEGGSILGSLQAIRSTFQKPISVLAQKVVFTASHLEAITVLRDGGFKGKQIVELKQGTIVQGSIHFESGKGEVLVFPGSQVLGPVTGGKVVRKS